VTAGIVVVDTNVVVSGLLTSDERAPTARLLDAMLSGELRFLLSVDLLAEYREVLLRPAIRQRHGLDERGVDALLTALAENAVVCEPIDPPSPPPDPGDLHLWSILAARQDAVLITGDRALLDDPPPWTTVISPAGFVVRDEL
jgi:putative PIN family toxin of toxin-antitoxin system